MFKLRKDGNVRRDTPDGYEVHTPDSPEYVKWLAEGNTPAPADPDPTPPDMSDPDNHVKAIKALALCIAEAAGWTIPQLRAKFKQKWDALP